MLSILNPVPYVDLYYSGGPSSPIKPHRGLHRLEYY